MESPAVSVTGVDRRVVRRAVRLLASPLLLAPLLSAPLIGSPALATQPMGRATQTQQEKDARLAVSEAAGDLEDSSAAVQAAAAALRTIASQLPAARADVARSRGELVGANAKAEAAAAALIVAEQAQQQARVQVDQAGVQVDQGRRDMGRLAYRVYSRGGLSDLRDVLNADEPQDMVIRAEMLRSVFRSQDRSLVRLTDARLALSRTRADLGAEERALDRARARADQDQARARAVAAKAEAAQTRVADLVRRRTAALVMAQTHRAQDLKDYAAAQAASRALAERIRASARRAAIAAAAEARRRAAEAAREAAAAAAANRPVRSNPPATSGRTGDMLWPAPGRLTSRYGWRTHPIYGDRRFHAGIDIGGGYGARVSAADGGVVTYAGYAQGYGTLVVVSHGVVNGKDLSTAYAHMSVLAVSAGQQVSRGDKVGEIGSEGNSTGPHLHFEVRRDGDPVDPLDYVSEP